MPPWVEKCFQLKLSDPHSSLHFLGNTGLIQEEEMPSLRKTPLWFLCFSRSPAQCLTPTTTRSMMEESKWAKFNTCIIGNQKHKKQKKKKVIHIHKQLQTCWLMCPSRSLFSELSIHFYVIKIIQLSCFFTHHEYLAKYQSYAILITKNTPLHQLHLEGSLLKSHVSSAPPNLSTQ